jgi:tetratricopeptide (TPR) repeat protein
LPDSNRYHGFLKKRRPLIGRCILAFLLFFWAPAYAALSAPADGDFAALAQKAYRNGDYEASVLLFSKAILFYPEQAELFLGSAKAWVKAGNLQQALNDAREAVRVAPERTEGYCMLAYVLHLSGEDGEALATVNIAVGLLPESPLAYYGRAIIREAASDFEQAIADYTEAIRLHKKMPRKTRTRGLYEFTDCAGRPFYDEKAAALYFGRGMAQSQNGDFKKARRELKRAVKIRPELALYLPEGITDTASD